MSEEIEEDKDIYDKYDKELEEITFELAAESESSILFDRMRDSIIHEITVVHPIICVTCISAGKFIPQEFWITRSEVRNMKDVHSGVHYRVIVDEAAQAKEPEILIPIIGAEQIVLIGDHKQLGPIMDR
jgi:hypothetical protein